MTPFYVGMKVKCVSQFNTMKLWGETYPVVGGEYTIRDIEPYHGKIGIRLEEILNPFYYYSGTKDCIFNSIRFRPIVKQKTSIDIFTAMLVKPRVPTEEEKQRQWAAYKEAADEWNRKHAAPLNHPERERA